MSPATAITAEELAVVTVAVLPTPVDVPELTEGPASLTSESAVGAKVAASDAGWATAPIPIELTSTIQAANTGTRTTRTGPT